jgi:hypothetical protein
MSRNCIEHFGQTDNIHVGMTCGLRKRLARSGFCRQVHDHGWLKGSEQLIPRALIAHISLSKVDTRIEGLRPKTRFVDLRV